MHQPEIAATFTLTEHSDRCLYRSASSELKTGACNLAANHSCLLPFGFQPCLHKDSRCGHKRSDAERLQCADDTQQAAELQKQHEQVQQQIQVAEQQLEAASTGKAESEHQLLTAQQGLDRYNTTSEYVCRHHAAVCCAELC